MNNEDNFKGTQMTLAKKKIQCINIPYTMTEILETDLNLTRVLLDP